MLCYEDTNICKSGKNALFAFFIFRLPTHYRM